MAHQASMTNGSRVRINSPLVEGVLGNLTNFGGDIASLAELQAKLTAADLKEGAGKAALPAAGLAVALLLVSASLPVLLFGIAELLAPALGLSRGLTLVLTAVAALVIGGVVGVLGAWRLGKSFVSLRRSREELTRNIAWIKTVLAYSGRPAPHQRKAT